MLILSNVLSDAQSCSSVPGVGVSCAPHRLFDAWNACPGAFLGNREITLCVAISMESPEHLWPSGFVDLPANFSDLFNKSPKVTLNSLTPVPNTDVCLGDPIPSGCPSSFLMFQTQVKRGLSSCLALWFGLGWGVFFLEFPKAASWVCLFPQHFKACPVPWLLGFWAVLVSDKSMEGKQPSWAQGVATSCRAVAKPPQPPNARPRRAEMLKFVPSWHCSGRANFVGEALWELQNSLIFIRNDNRRRLSQGCSESFVCLLPPSTLTNTMERISLGFLQETPYGIVCPCCFKSLRFKGKMSGFG